MYQVHTVSSTTDKRKFLEFPVWLYREDKNWIRPLDADIERVFDAEANKLFRSGACIRWLLLDDKGKVCGRVAAFYDGRSARKNKQPTGGMGFFECIEDQQAAFTLFDACKKWLQEQGMEAMDGPVNFGDRNTWWGLLTDGFYEPIYGMGYHKRYYAAFFEAYGFKNYFNQYTYFREIDPKATISEELRQKAERILRQPGYTFRTFDPAQASFFIDSFIEVYNRGWAKFEGIKPLTRAHGEAMFKSIRPIMDPRLLIFAFYEEQPVAFFLSIPDLNQALKHINGKLNLWGKLVIMYHLKIKKSVTNIIGTIFGITPEFQGRGVDSAMVVTLQKIILQGNFQYKTLQLNWIGDFNPAMQKVAEQVGTRIYKTHVTYRLLFNPEAPFERAALVNVRRTPSRPPQAPQTPQTPHEQ
jgi:hypothetical protein